MRVIGNFVAAMLVVLVRLLLRARRAFAVAGAAAVSVAQALAALALPSRHPTLILDLAFATGLADLRPLTFARKHGVTPCGW